MSSLKRFPWPETTARRRHGSGHMLSNVSLPQERSLSQNTPGGLQPWFVRDVDEPS